MGVVPKGFQAVGAESFVGTTPVRVGEAYSDHRDLKVRNLRRWSRAENSSKWIANRNTIEILL